MQTDLKQLEISETALQAMTGVPRTLSSSSHARSQEDRKLLKFTIVATSIAALIALLSSLCYFVPNFRIPAAIFAFCLLFGASCLAMEMAELALIGFAFALAAGAYAIYTLTAFSFQVVLWSIAIAGAMALGVAVLIQVIPLGFSKNRNYGSPKPSKSLARLYGEVDKYNKVIRDIHVFDQLEAAGNPIRLHDRESVLSALKITHGDLVRALKTEKILRENPDFNPEQFAIDLNAFHAIQVSEQAGEYGQFFDTTMQIAIAVQKTMRDLQKHA
ncbi:hypothetical protein TUMEXPCC7403_11215 [Tumidithrix helvetica PCC 7403]|uniref:hypothetical protein n=1 Tax=Tumidithrix helvetica TaxID=3457545 RepID=UPI003CA147E8